MYWTDSQELALDTPSNWCRQNPAACIEIGFGLLPRPKPGTPLPAEQPENCPGNESTPFQQPRFRPIFTSTGDDSGGSNPTNNPAPPAAAAAGGAPTPPNNKNDKDNNEDGFKQDVDNSWHKGSYNSAEESLKDRFKRHGAESPQQYLHKANKFAENLKGARKVKVGGFTEGVTKYIKNDKYILMKNGKVFSFGRVK